MLASNIRAIVVNNQVFTTFSRQTFNVPKNTPAYYDPSQSAKTLDHGPRLLYGPCYFYGSLWYFRYDTDDKILIWLKAADLKIGGVIKSFINKLRCHLRRVAIGC